MASGGGEAAGGGGLEEEESLLLFHRGGGGETEALLRAAGAGQAGQAGQAGEEAAEAGDELDGEDPELRGLRRRLQGWLWPYGGLLMALQRLLVWERPLYSVCTALTLNTLFWLLSSTSLRPLFLLSVSLLGLMLLERWKHKLPLITVQHAEPEPSQEQREAGSVEPRLLSVPELSHHLADSYLTCCLYLQEMMQYKRLYHGKFCIMMCSGCAVLAVVGHYVPGIMISYIMALSVLLWPLVVYHELIQRMYTGLEPILMKLDYSMKGGAEHRKHDKRIIALLREVKKELEGDEPCAETESDSEEEELSCFAPTVDVKTTALAMAITDSELSDEEASILESGGFSVSRATTPQLTDLSEDLEQQSHHSDPDESFLRDLPEFPSVEEFPSIDHSLFHFPLRGPQAPQGPPASPPGPQAPPGPQGPQADAAQAGQPSDGEPLSPASLLLQHLASPLHFVNTHFNGHSRPPGGEEGGPAAASVGLLLGGVAEEEEEEQEEEEGRGGAGGGVASCPVPPQHHRSPLEALSEEIVSTAISTVVQNTLSALLRSGEDQEDEDEEGSLDPFLLPTQTLSSLDHHHLLPTETPSTPDRLTPTETTCPSLAGRSPAVETLSPLEQTLPTETTTTTTSSSSPDVPEETSPGALETTTTATDHSRSAAETASSPDLPTETTADPPGPPPETTDEAEPAAAALTAAVAPSAVTAAAVDEAEATTLAEDEDFELLDQSELEQAEEGEGLGLAAAVGGVASGATDTPPSPQHQPRES